MTLRSLLFVALGVLSLIYVFRWIVQARTSTPSRRRPSAAEHAIGFGTNFFDTLGIGSFAPTTALYRLMRIVPDEHIPGTLNVGHTPPVIAQAFIFIAIVQVDPTTLATMIAAAVLGAWLGAGVVARLPRRRIQLGMGVALLIAATMFLMAIFGLFPAGGSALGLSGVKLAVAVTGAFVLGSLMTIGVGNYAPSMIMISLLGMNPATAFPIMMGSAAFLMPVASLRFLKAGRYSLTAALGLAAGGVPAVLVAAFIVKSLPLTALRWLVVAVVLFTAVGMLRSALREGDASAARASPEPLPRP